MDTRNTRGGFSLGQSRKTRFAPAATLSSGNLYIKFSSAIPPPTIPDVYIIFFARPLPPYNPFYTLNRSRDSSAASKNNDFSFPILYV